MSTIELSGVSKRFGASVALDGISLRVESGETVAIIGASGAGKTVLLRLVAGVEDPSGGTITIGGADMADVAPERRGIGMAFQNFALFPHMTAFDNIASPLSARGASAGEVRRGVESVARMLKIESVLDHRPRALSNGQKQRTALARALAASPTILLLDDPLRNVDAKLRFEMRLEFERLLAEQGATTLYVTQDYREAMALGHRIAVMDQGRLVQVGTPEEIYFEPAGIEVARQFGDPTINLVPAHPASDDRGAFATVGGARLDLAPGADAVANGRECMVGIRPEALAFTEDAAGPFVVEAVTPLNEKVVTLVAGAEGTELLVSRPSHEPTRRPGERVSLHVAAREVLLFAREDGARLSGAGAGAGAGAGSTPP
ncbi:MAG: ABC transporter ATP-binding protein [Thiotrichales bacterium]|nr:ABC transporter ATP-binding protein [Thiotrichales bacterium]